MPTTFALDCEDRFDGTAVNADAMAALWMVGYEDDPNRDGFSTERVPIDVPEFRAHRHRDPAP